MVRLPRLRQEFGSGLHAPARFFVCAAFCLALPGVAAAQAQTPPRAAQQPALPDALTISKLIWSTMAAVDHANVTGNYSVLRDLGAPSFQANNNAAALASVFQGIRNQRVDLGNVLLVSPNYEIPPTFVDGGLLRVRGIFPLRPTAIGFDLLFQPVGGRWALFGVSVAPIAQIPASQQQRR